MGEFIRKRIGNPDAIVSSDAHRARQTAETAAEAIGFEAPIALEHAVYDAGLPDLIDVVRAFPATAETVLLVGHNPGCEALAVALAGLEAGTVHLPTAGLVHLESTVAWRDVAPNTARLVTVQTPRDTGA
jgi:phosphohistidine phosphatase